MLEKRGQEKEAGKRELTQTIRRDVKEKLTYKLNLIKMSVQHTRAELESQQFKNVLQIQIIWLLF